MTDREKLIEALGRFSFSITVNGETLADWNIPMPQIKKALADHLLDNGVTFATDTNVGSKVETNVYDIEEIHHDCTVQILTNSVTGEQSIGWWPNNNPPLGF